MANTTHTITEEAANARYAAMLPAMPIEELLRDMRYCARNNEYGIHTDQIVMIEAEIVARCAR